MANFSKVPVYSERFTEALAQVSDWHRYQVRKQNSIPYVSHLLSVAALVMEAGGTEDEAIAALCHDAVEDVEIPLEEIRHHWCDRVAFIVSALSEDKALPKEQRKQAYVESIRKGDCSVVLVSAADKLHNIRCYAHNPELFKKEVAVFYSKLIPVYVDKLGLNHRFVWEMIKIWEELKRYSFKDKNC